jgi:predicted acyl esterase
MLGASYLGLTQYLVGPTRPPHLKVLFAQMGWGSAYAIMFRGGVYQLGQRTWWPMGMVLQRLQDETATPHMEAGRAHLEKGMDEIEGRYRHLPIKSLPPLEGLADWYFEQLDHPEDGPYWWPTDLSTMISEVDLPILHWNG